MSDVAAGGPAAAASVPVGPAIAPTPAAATAIAKEPAQYVWLYQKQQRIYPRAVTGRFAAWRWALVWATQLVYYGLPWLTWNGRPAVLFDLAARRFYLGPLVLHPQDFVYLTVLLVISAYALFLFTAVAGRLWCGYACPQTVYTEMFLWLERRIEGDRIARMRLDAAPWSAAKVGRKVAKHGAWIALSLWTGLTLVGYFTPIRELLREAATLSFGPWEWFWIVFYALATYGNAGWLREQVCKYMCPYARFQSAMFDRDTLVVGYDVARGEPRGSRSRRIADPRSVGKGDCIDCGLCVQVCPTGIDIRQGLQYECIGCAACVDVCDGVMDKMGYPRGLIRYDTQNGQALRLDARRKWRRVARPRVLGYAAVLALIVAAFVASLATRDPLRIDVVRDRAVLARIVDDGHVENVYRMQLMNATERAQRVALTAVGIDGLAIAGPAIAGDRRDVELAPAESRWITLAVRLAPDAALAAGAGAHPIRFVARARAGERGDGRSDERGDEGDVVIDEPSTFVVPR